MSLREAYGYIFTTSRTAPPAPVLQMPNPLSLNKRRGFDGVSLTMTYFHARECTIIGAVSFHCPVRDGKEWFQDAMVVRL